MSKATGGTSASHLDMSLLLWLDSLPFLVSIATIPGPVSIASGVIALIFALPSGLCTGKMNLDDFQGAALACWFIFDLVFRAPPYLAMLAGIGVPWAAVAVPVTLTASGCTRRRARVHAHESGHDELQRVVTEPGRPK